MAVVEISLDTTGMLFCTENSTSPTSETPRMLIGRELFAETG
ncbi:MAG TPA: hypothetical protein VET30_08690 [Pseudoxanthomonas sp.]|nr:hypothetical protein [Pseudoxanthomonas sp.]